MAEMILVEGLASINRSLARTGPRVAKATRLGLLQAAEPVRRDATRLAQTEITGMKRSRIPWYAQRLGRTVHEVYIAPQQRGVKSRTDRSRRRPDFAQLMLGKAYEPALARDEPLVRASVDRWLTQIGREF